MGGGREGGREGWRQKGVAENHVQSNVIPSLLGLSPNRIPKPPVWGKLNGRMKIQDAHEGADWAHPQVSHPRQPKFLPSGRSRISRKFIGELGLGSKAVWVSSQSKTVHDISFAHISLSILH